MSNTDISSTLVDVYEKCLSRPLKRSDLAKSPLTLKDLSALARAVSDHYRHYSLPNKNNAELRPSISPGFTTSHSVGLDYVSGYEHYRGTFNYEFDATAEGKMTDNLKRYLLYCHGLVFEDPLPYLLDYFEHNIESDVALRRLPAVNALLSEYADLKELITGGILLPISHSPIILNDLPVLKDTTLEDLGKRLPSLPSDVVEMLAHKVLEEQYRRRRLNNNVDLFFPHTDYVLVLRELLKLEEKKFASTVVSEPFGLAVLGNIATLNPSALTTADLVRIRINDELFSEWRVFLNRVFKDLQVSEPNFTSVEDEFFVALTEEFVLWRHRFDARLKRGSIKAAFSESGTNISIGMVAGAITGMLGGDPTTSILGALTGGAVGGLVQPGIELVKNIVQSSAQRAEVSTLRHHFLALGILDPKGRERS